MDKKENNSQDENKEQPTSTMTVNNGKHHFSCVRSNTVSKKTEKETKTEKSKVVVAIGTSGVGKSSVLNLLCGRNTAFKTSDSTEPCTVHWSASGWDEKDICLVDTADPEIPDVSEKSLYEVCRFCFFIYSSFETASQFNFVDRVETSFNARQAQDCHAQKENPTNSFSALGSCFIGD